MNMLPMSLGFSRIIFHYSLKAHVYSHFNCMLCQLYFFTIDVFKVNLTFIRNDIIIWNILVILIYLLIIYKLIDFTSIFKYLLYIYTHIIYTYLFSIYGGGLSAVRLSMLYKSYKMIWAKWPGLIGPLGLGPWAKGPRGRVSLGPWAQGAPPGSESFL